MRNLSLVLTGFLLGLLTAFVVAARGADAVSASGPGGGLADWDRLLREVRAQIHAHYVDPVDDAQLDGAALRGMVESLDPHSQYLDATQFAALRRHVAGGGGAEAGAAGGGGEFPADTGAGDGKDADGAGGADRPARVQWRRLAPGFGYLRIPYFSHDTPGEVAAALARFPDGALSGLVIDLRGNPGGVVTAAAAVADDFLDSGLIVRGEGRGAGDTFRIDATPGDVLRGAPLVLLVDGGTASAAEILAATLKDHGRARLLGRRTWGKGTVQSLIPLSSGALRLTTARYFTPGDGTPGGGGIGERGIMPDIPGPMSGPAVAHPSADDPDAALALRVLREAAAAAGF